MTLIAVPVRGLRLTYAQRLALLELQEAGQLRGGVLVRKGRGGRARVFDKQHNELEIDRRGEVHPVPK